MTPDSPTAFALPDRLAAKADPALIADDEARFAAIGAAIAASRNSVAERLAALRHRWGGEGEAALERDLEIHRLTGHQRTLSRFGLDLCLGRVTGAALGEPRYVGRTGMTDAAGDALLVDWRAPAAEPYFAATPAHPLGVALRRRYRFRGGRVVDYWDEALTDDPEASAALDEESSFIAGLGASRSARMRDVLSTIQADQDAVIRRPSAGALVVDGGPGTGKTVVALHRAAYLLYADPRLEPGRGGILFVGPHEAYLAYVDDILPSLGEESVQMCTLRDLVPEGRTTRPEPDPRTAALKGDARWSDAIETAVARAERPPREAIVVETPWMDVTLTPDDWAEAFAAPAPGTPHDEARDEIAGVLADIVVDRMRPGRSTPGVRRFLARSTDLAEAIDRAWPMLDPVGLVAALWESESLLRACAPWIDDDGARLLRRADGRAFTDADLPLLDAARARIGDPAASTLARRRAAELAARQQVMESVVDDLIAADDSELRLMSMLRVEDAQRSLVDESGLPARDLDRLAGPFAHIVVDEAQELTDAEWGMLLRRCPSRSFTVVGDRAQARRGFPESWERRLARVGIPGADVARLTVNYRTPEEVMAVAEPVIRAVLPDANVPASIRRSGVPVVRGTAAELDAILDGWLASHEDGVACVIGDPGRPDAARVRSLPPEGTKGLEFDLVVLVHPERFGTGIEGGVDRYVAMTRSTRELVILD